MFQKEFKITENITIPADQFKFLSAELISFIFGLLMRHYLPPSSQNVIKRHLSSMILGFMLTIYCFGIEMITIFLIVSTSYLFIKLTPRKYVQMITFVFLISCMSFVHLYYQIFYYGDKSFDITSPLMILTQKLTLLAFSYYDGLKSDELLTADQKTQVVRQEPTILEFFSFAFNFQGILVGPSCFYNDYIDYITGNSILKHTKKVDDKTDKTLENVKPIEQPSIKGVILRKATLVLVLIIIYFNVTLVYPFKVNMMPETLAKPIWYRLFYFYVSASSPRVKYYIAWTLADIVSNASGLGFNGYDYNGDAKWNLVTGVNILTLETCTSTKVFLDNWNIQTQLWLRRIVYDRLSSGTGRTLGVFVLSAFWHGFYPGYYLTFILTAFVTYAGRKIRRNIRPLFMINKSTMFIYSLFGWFVTIFVINYAAASFYLLEIEPSFEFYKIWFWIVHINSVFVLLFPIGAKKSNN